MSNCDLSMIPNEVVRTVLHETVENRLKSNKYNVIVSSASQAGENNFLGVVYRVSFNKEQDNGNDGQTSKLILKVAPQNATQRAQFFSRQLFLREIYLYDVVLPHFREFELSKALTVEDIFNEYPKCYRANDTEPNECVLLEDMAIRGFSIIDRCDDEVTADHVHVMMKSLGKFHAISLALRDQRPEQFQKLTANFSEIFVRKDDAFLRAYYEKQVEFAVEVVSGEKDVHLLVKLKKLLEKEAIDIAVDCLGVSSDSASVISHGDTWQNNIMFRFDGSGKPIEACFLDWQISRYSSPVIDIVYFMFSCTTKALRDKHYDSFLRTYHDSLSNHVRRLGSDPEKLFSFKVLQEHLRKFGRFGFILAASILLPIILSDKGHVVDMDELADKIVGGGEVSSDLFTSAAARSRMRGRIHDIIVDMVRLEYI